MENNIKKPTNISYKDWEILKSIYGSNLKVAIDKLQAGYPIQYLIGNVEFLNCLINVDERVLIPRYETEYLVYLVIEYARKKFTNKISIIDLGTGSGCIAIALKKELNSTVTATDISTSALELAKENANNNKVVIKFIKQDILKPLTGKYDIIISNPPYIAFDGYVAPNVLKYEPHIALFAKDHGTYFLKKIIHEHINNLNKPGLMALEIGDNTEAILKEFLREYPNLKYKFIPDLTGRIRYLFIFNE